MDALAAIGAVSAQLSPAKAAEIDRKAQDFEAMVLSQLLKPMFDSAKTPALMGGDGPGEDAFNDMLQDEYARAIAARGGVGIADEIKGELIRLQSEMQYSRDV